jgi:TonB family protein
MQTTVSGFQIYIPRNTSSVYDGSVKLGSALTETIKSDFNIEPELKQVQDNGNSILILKKATVPSVLIECGYMDNPADMKYLQNEKSQEKIARDILEGIRRYGSETISYFHTKYVTGTSQDYKIISQREAQALPGAIQSLGIDYKRYVYLIAMKDGQKFAYEMSDEEKKWVDNPKELEKYVKEHENELREVKKAWDSAAPLKKVEVQADFPGGVNGWKAYLTKNLKYPDEAANNEVQGEVIVQFVVNTDGSLSDVHAISGPGRLRAESVRVVKESGYWIPAKDKGVTVASIKKQPIDYKLEVK